MSQHSLIEICQLKGTIPIYHLHRLAKKVAQTFKACNQGTLRHIWLSHQNKNRSLVRINCGEPQLRRHYLCNPSILIRLTLILLLSQKKWTCQHWIYLTIQISKTRLIIFIRIPQKLATVIRFQGPLKILLILSINSVCLISLISKPIIYRTKIEKIV